MAVALLLITGQAWRGSRTQWHWNHMIQTELADSSTTISTRNRKELDG